MITEEDLAKLEEIVFVLEGRDKPTFLCLSVGSYKKAEELAKEVEKRLPAYRFETLNLRGQQVTSLYYAIKTQVPARLLESKPVEYVLNVFGLEDSLFITRGDKPAFSNLIQELNIERENLFRTFPFCILLWTTPYFVDSLKKHAPDLWDWITYSYWFDDTECLDTGPSFKSTVPVMLPPGRSAEREQRIKELEDKFRSLGLRGSTERVIREKVTIQKLLGQEYTDALHISEGIRAYQAVLALLGQVPHLPLEEAEVHFLLGTTCLKGRKFDQAHNNLQVSLDLQQDSGESSNIGGTYHLIGMVYHEQRHWNKALENYQKALDWDQKIGHHHLQGNTYHQIGLVHQEQRRWNEALESYQKALDWNNKTGQVHELGGTYHQIGIVEQQQRRWTESLENYQMALDWNKRTGQFHELGGTYHQIGTIHEEQRRWSEALASYQEALNWNEQTGQFHELGVTYRQVGRVHEEQRRWSEALKWYLSALLADTLHDQANIETIESSIARVRGKVRRAARERLLEQVAGQATDEVKAALRSVVLGKR